MFVASSRQFLTAFRQFRLLLGTMIRVNRDEPWRDEQVGTGLSSRDREPCPATTSQAICQEMRGMQATFEGAGLEVTPTTHP